MISNLAGLELLGDFLALLGGSLLLLSLLLLAHRESVVLLVPLTERGGIDLHDRVLEQHFCSHKLVVRGIVHHIEDARLARASLGGPREGTSVQTQSAELLVTSTSAHNVHSLLVGHELGVGCHTPDLVLALLLVDGSATSGQPALVAGIAGNSHFCLTKGS